MLPELTEYVLCDSRAHRRTSVCLGNTQDAVRVLPEHTEVLLCAPDTTLAAPNSINPPTQAWTPNPFSNRLIPSAAMGSTATDDTDPPPAAHGA